MIKKLTDKAILKDLEKNKKLLIKYSVKKIGLFGSFARGDQKKNSDIDFLVEFELSKFGKNFNGLYEAFMGLSNYLEGHFKRKIELITDGSLSPYIKPYVEKEVVWYETKRAVS